MSVLRRSDQAIDFYLRYRDISFKKKTRRGRWARPLGLQLAEFANKSVNKNIAFARSAKGLFARFYHVLGHRCICVSTCHCSSCRPAPGLVGYVPSPEGALPAVPALPAWPPACFHRRADRGAINLFPVYGWDDACLPASTQRVLPHGMGLVAD